MPAGFDLSLLKNLSFPYYPSEYYLISAWWVRFANVSQVYIWGLVFVYFLELSDTNKYSVLNKSGINVGWEGDNIC